MKNIYVLGTMDTKGEELSYIGEQIRASGAEPLLVDVGTQTAPQAVADISCQEVASHHPDGIRAVLGLRDRGEAVTAMSKALVGFLTGEYEAGKVSGVIGIGGSGGTALITPAMRALPIGVPKVMVSTVASGNTLPYVGTSDLTMMNSVVDVAGINRVSRRVLGNAARAVSGMVRNAIDDSQDRRMAGITMFGVTTPCVTAVRQALEEKDWDCLVFHATGTGGQAMETLAANGVIQGLLDLTTTEVADEVVGGVFPAGPNRFDLLAVREIPCVLSLGALDMVNFGALDTVPEKFRKRKLHVHNAQVTLMRTSPEENRRFAEWIVPKLNRAKGDLVLLIPEKGISLLDATGQPFYDPAADKALFDEIEKQFLLTTKHKLIRLPYHINDAAFAQVAVEEFEKIESNAGVFS